MKVRALSPRIARVMLLCCAALWGGSYPAAKLVMRHVGPQWLMALRLTGACIIMLILFHRHIVPHLTKAIIFPAFVVGVTYWGTMVTQMQGLRTIEPGRSAFLTSAYCVLTPFVAWAVTKVKPKFLNCCAAILCILGVGLVGLKPGEGFALALSSGDWLTLACALIFSLNLTCLGLYTRKFNPIAMTFVQFAVASIGFWVGALATEPGPNSNWFMPEIIIAICYLFAGATMLAQVMQNVGLSVVPASSASIIMCTESVFSITFSALFFGEKVGVNTAFGFAFIFIAVLLSVTSSHTRLHRPKSDNQQNLGSTTLWQRLHDKLRKSDLAA